MSAETLEILDLSLRVGRARREILRRVDLRFARDAYTVVMGPSGAGKSSLLRVIGGHLEPSAGTIRLGTRSLAGVPPERRPVHTLWQDAALFPHLDVQRNVAFAGLAAGRSLPRCRERVDELLDAVGLAPRAYAARGVASLSGGEAQRVALARALFVRPAFVLLDEPLAALDPDRRASLRRRLARVQREQGVGFVHVTHDAPEALALADHLVVLLDGEVAAQGPGQALYAAPSSLEVARLLGELVALPETTERSEGPLGSPAPFIRPEHLRLRADEGGRARLLELERRPAGPTVHLRVAWGGSAREDLAADPARSAWAGRAGEPVELRVPVAGIPSAPIRSVDWEADHVLRLA